MTKERETFNKKVNREGETSNKKKHWRKTHLTETKKNNKREVETFNTKVTKERETFDKKGEQGGGDIQQNKKHGRKKHLTETKTKKKIIKERSRHSTQK